MPIVKNYLRYDADASYGVIASAEGNGVILSSTLVAMPALQDVLIWCTKTGTVVKRLSESKHIVTCMCKSPTQQQIAVGYHNGDIQIWDFVRGESLVLFSGHRSAVTCLSFSEMGTNLVSGSQDTDIIVWDVINEAGVFRLRGHKGPVHAARLLESRNLLVSCSRDTLVKFWDLDTQHCVHTIIGHRAEVNDFALLNDDTRVVTASADDELRVWDIAYHKEFSKADLVAGEQRTGEGIQDGEHEDDNNKGTSASNGKENGDAVAPSTKKAKTGDVEAKANPITTAFVGSIMKKGQGRVLRLILTTDNKCIFCQNAGKSVDTFRVRTDAELQKRKARKLKRQREKGKDVKHLELTLSDLYPHAGLITCPSNVRSVDVAAAGKDTFSLLTALTSNAFETYTVKRTAKGMDSERATSISLQGHRKPIRGIALSADAALVLTTSNSTAKLWNRQTGQCIRTLHDAGYGVSCVFVPGDRQALIGTKDGQLKLYDLASGECLQAEEDAHTKPIWSIALSPDKQGFITGSADRSVKFWQFELIQSEDKLRKTLSIEHTKTLQMTDEVTCACFSPDSRLLAVALLDSTVKVVYADTLKPFLSLYGHKLPVVSMDISSDSTLLATGSADKNVKIWGLDFGDCHKSFRAHQDTVTDVCFAGTTHYVFSVSKDNTVKQWDAGNFRLIQTLEGHHGPISCCAIAPRGEVLVTGSHDKSVRTWVRTREMLNVEEEEALAREQEYDEQQAEQEGREYRAKAGDDEVAAAGKRSIETLKAAERLIEAVQIARDDEEKGKGGAINPMFLAHRVKTGAEFVRAMMEKTPSSELEQALMLMPFALVPAFLRYLLKFATEDQSVEKTARAAVFLLRLHHSQFVATAEHLNLVAKLQQALPHALSELKELVGFNLAALRFLRARLEERTKVYM